jgi:hypothetical protein
LARAKAQQDELLAPRAELLDARDEGSFPVDEEDNDAARSPHIAEYQTPPSRTMSTLDIRNSSALLCSSNDDGDEME